MSGQPAAEPNPQEFRPSSRRVALDFLEYIFQSLIDINTSFVHVYGDPTSPESPRLCNHDSPRNGIRHLSEMAGQAERMAYIGLLLRTAEIAKDPQQFKEALKCNRPELEHGVAILQFLTAGLCRNDRQTPVDLLQLVQALKSNESCLLNHHLRGPIDVVQVCNEVPRNCILTLIRVLLDQCKECADVKCVQDLIEKLGADLDPVEWHGCGDCELILLDILMYTRMLPNSDRRMMASLRLSFDYNIDLGLVDDLDSETVAQCKALQIIINSLFKLGLGRINLGEPELRNGSHLTGALECEVLFLSGWQEEEEKRDNVRLLHDNLQEKRKKRPFYIQCKYLQTQQDEYQRRCCEPQMHMCLDRIALQLEKTHKKFVEPFELPISTVRVQMILEQDPCAQCAEGSMAEIIAQLPQSYPNCQTECKLSSMLEYEKKEDSNLTFLKRLMEPPAHDGPPVLLPKAVLEDFQERLACMADGQCMNVRCNELCQYSTPSNILAVTELRELEIIRTYEWNERFCHRRRFIWICNLVRKCKLYAIDAIAYV